MAIGKSRLSLVSQKLIKIPGLMHILEKAAILLVFLA
jgi:hypothetical protein